MEILTRTGPLAYPVLIIAGAWILYALLHGLAALGRRRLPAPLYWLFPALVLAAGGGGALFVQSEMTAALAGAGAAAQRIEVLGYADTGVLIYLATAATTAILVASGPWLALANVARGGKGARWTPTHALPAVVAAVVSLTGFVSGPLTVGVGLVGAFSIGLASIRVGRASELRRHAAGRALIGAIATGSAASLALVLLVSRSIERLEATANAPYTERQAILDGIRDATPWEVGGALAVAVALAVASLATLAPVGRALLDGRTSGGFLFSVFLAIVPAATLAPSILPLTQADLPDAAGQRQQALRRLGIELVEAAPQAPWTPGIPVTLGVYWVHVDDTRALPFLDGAIAPESLDGQAALPIMEALAGRDGEVRLEVDRRVDMKRLNPVLHALQRRGHTDICFVVRTRTGTPGCQPASLADPGRDDAHLLLRSMDATLVMGDAEPVVVAIDSVVEQLGERRLVVHGREDVSATRLVQALVHLTESDPPILDLD